MSNVDRRAFLKVSAAGVAAVTLPGTLLAEEMKKKEPVVGLRPHENQPERAIHVGDFVSNKGNPFEGTVKDSAGRPIAGVTVTNGRDAVKTGADGRFKLPEWEASRFISVTPPSGYVCTNWFYDTWNRFDHDFQLVWTGKNISGGCRFIQVTDSEIDGPDAGQGFVDNLKALGDKENVAFYVHTGDICGDRGMRAHFQIMTDYTMKRPTYYCLGNHDSVSTWPYGEAEFEALFGPCWHSFETGGIHFVVTPMVNGGDRPGGYTEGDVARWLANDLKLVPKGMPVIVFNHWICNDGDAEKCGFVYGDKDFELKLKEACNYRGWIYGHSHNTWFKRVDGVAFVNSSNPNKGGIDHSPNVARVFTVTGKGDITSESFFGDYRGWQVDRAGAKWEVKLASGVLHGGITDGGSVIYVASNDDDGRGTGYLYALDKATGREVWKTRLANTIKGEIVLAGGKLFGADVEKVAHAFDAATGKELWSYDLCDEKVQKRFRSRMHAHGGAVSPDGSKVALGCGYILKVFDVATGRIVWKHGKEYMQQATSVSPLFTDKYLVVPLNWGPCLCYEADTGKVAWKFNGRFPGAKPCLAGDHVFHSDGGAIYEIELATGKVVQDSGIVGRRFACPGNLLVTDTMVLKGAVNEGLVALDRKDLKKKIYSAPVGAGLVSASEYAGCQAKTLNTSPLLFDEDTVVASAADGAIHFWNLKDGVEKRTIRTGAPYLASALVSDGTVFAADLAGYVRAW